MKLTPENQNFIDAFFDNLSYRLREAVRQTDPAKFTMLNLRGETGAYWRTRMNQLRAEEADRQERQRL
jgi:hypothetical protein